MSSRDLYVLCVTGGYSFAILASRVRTIASRDEVTDVPLHDLGRLLGAPPADPTERTAVVVVDLPDGPVGLIVEGAADVAELSDDDLVLPPDFGPSLHLAYLAALARKGDAFSIVLDVERLLSATEVAHA